MIAEVAKERRRDDRHREATEDGLLTVTGDHETERTQRTTLTRDDYGVGALREGLHR
jgi:hypothetical protein